LKVLKNFSNQKAVSGSPSVVRCSSWPEAAPQRTAKRGQRTSFDVAKRIIPCLDLQGRRVVKGVRFVNLRDAGDPGELAEMYNARGADELVSSDISASREGPRHAHDTVNRVARKLFIPLTVGVVCDPSKTLGAALGGADKVAVNTAAVETPDLISELAARYGRQAVVVAIDARRARTRNSTIENRHPTSFGVRSFEPRASGRLFGVRVAPGWLVVTYGGTRPTGLTPVEWARRVEALGAGKSC